MTDRAPQPARDAPDDGDPGERTELRDSLLTFGPAIVVAFVLNWVLKAQTGWSAQRALLTSIAVGIVVALVVQRAMHRRAS